MTKDPVSAWCYKLTESAGEQLSLWVFYDVGIDQVFSRSCGVFSTTIPSKIHGSSSFLISSLLILIFIRFLSSITFIQRHGYLFLLLLLLREKIWLWWLFTWLRL